MLGVVCPLRVPRCFLIPSRMPNPNARPFHPPRHLRLVVVVLILLGLGLLWGLLLAQLRSERERALALASASNDMLATLLERHAERTLRAADETLRAMGQIPPLGIAALDLPTFMRLHRDHEDPYVGALLVDAQGRVAAAFPDGVQMPVVGASAPAWSLWQTHREQGLDARMLIGTPRADGLRANRLLDLSLPLRHIDGGFAGVAVLSLSTDYFADTYTAYATERGAAIELMLEPQTALVTVGNLPEGVAQLLSQRRLSAYPVRVQVSTSQDMALRDFSRQHAQRYQMGVIATLTILASGAVLLWLVRRDPLWRRWPGAKKRGTTDQLQASARRLEEAQRVAQVGNWEYDLLSGRLVWSAELFRLFEVDPRRFEVNFDAFLALIHPDDRETVNKAYADSLLHRQPYTVVHRIQLADGRIKWLEEKCLSDFDAAGRPVRSMGTTQDITERKALEDALRASESELRNIIAQEPDGIHVLDEGMRVVHMNPAGLAMLEAVSVEQLASWRLADLVAPRDRQAYNELHHRVLQGGSAQLEFEVIGLRGTRRQIETRAVPLRESGRVRHLGLTRDITDKKRAQDERQIAAVAFEGQEPMVIMDGQRVIRQVNQAFVSSIGFSAEDLVGQPFDRMRSARHEDLYYQAICDTAQRAGRWRGEVWWRHRRGHDIPCWMVVTAVKNLEGEVKSYVLSMFDITERKASESRLLALNHELTQSRQQLRELAALNEAAREGERQHIAREVHDELGQVLTALRMDISLLGMRFGALDPQVGEQVTSMKSLVDRAIQGVRNVATDLRPSALDMGLMPALQWLCSEFARRGSVMAEFIPPAQDVDLGAERSVVLFRIVQESLTNVTRHAGASRVTVRLTTIGPMLQLDVSDNGSGFDVEAAVSRKSFGLLGMRERALALAGEWHIKSAPGAGTVVTVTIPLNPLLTEALP